MPRLTLALLLLSTAALADTEICQTVNGRTTCTRAEGNVSCVTINGETQCTPIDPDKPPPLPEISMPGVEVRQEGGRTVIIAGGTEVTLPK